MLSLAMLLAVSGHAATIRSLVPVAGNPYAEQQGRAYGRVVRLGLTDREQQTVIPIGLELTLQSADKLQARIDRGEVLTRSEIEAYLPSTETYNSVREWLVQQGFSVTLESNFRHAVFVRGSVQQCATAFQTTFGRVATADGEFTSALVEPTLPASISSSVRLVRGLQTHLIGHHLAVTLTPRVTPYGWLDPATLAAHYNAPANLTGAGQTIAVLGDEIPSTSDLTQFWSTCGIPQSLSNYTVVNMQGGPVNAPSTGLAMQEAELDVQWASGIASGAAVRFYATPYPLTNISEAAVYTQVLNDLPNNPSIHQVSESFSSPETPPSTTFQLLAAQGVSCFAGSGDSGSNPNWATEMYDSTQPLSVGYPACDPNVTGVGGTNLALDMTTGQPITPEIAWYSDWPVGNTGTGLMLATGGGISACIPRPSWQTGTGLPSGTTRCVPDVAAIADCDIASLNAYGLAPLVIEGGKMCGQGGTSLSTPVWAGLAALMNQSRSDAGLKPIGLLNARIYALIGTNAFNDITVGTNGAYTAGVGYDLCTGLGSPNVANLIAALEAPPPGLSVSVSAPLPSATVVNGSSPITLTALATGSSPEFQWYLNGVAIAGATNSTETVYPTAANQGVYAVTVTNSAGTATASAETLKVSTDAWLVNLSARAYAETGTNQLIAGFVTTGTANKSLLIRGDGPALGGFGITDFMSDPQLTLVSGSSTVATTTSWASSLDAVFAQVGAFGITAGSHDTALLETLSPGAYTAQVVSQTTNSGVALAEIYDADAGAPTNRLTNISARAFVGTGSSILVGGFVIGGSTPQSVVIRGDGPSLAGFGLTGALSSTTLTLSNSNGTLATNTGWGNAPVMGPAADSSIVIQPLTAALSAKVGAFALAVGSNDSAMVVTLPPGAYTAQVSGANVSTGVALVEIYELR
jgi:kumamolisin